MEKLLIEKFRKLTPADLQITGKKWNQRTTGVVVHCTGGANMFGGHGWDVHLIIHGENSIKETGSIEVAGMIGITYNISRGANGPDSSSANYYRPKNPIPVSEFAGMNDSFEQIHQISVTGSCGGAESIMIAEKCKAIKDFINE